MGGAEKSESSVSDGPLQGSFDYLVCISLECTCDDDSRVLPREDMEVHWETGETERGRERERDRQTDRQTDRAGRRGPRPRAR